MWEHLSKHSDASADRARFTFCMIFSLVTLDAHKTQHTCMKKVITHYTSDKTTPSLSCLTGDQTTPGTTLPVLIPRGKFLIHNATSQLNQDYHMIQSFHHTAELDPAGHTSAPWLTDSVGLRRRQPQRG